METESFKKPRVIESSSIQTRNMQYVYNRKLLQHPATPHNTETLHVFRLLVMYHLSNRNPLNVSNEIYCLYIQRETKEQQDTNKQQISQKNNYTKSWKQKWLFFKKIVINKLGSPTGISTVVLKSSSQTQSPKALSQRPALLRKLRGAPRKPKQSTWEWEKAGKTERCGWFDGWV